MSATLATQAFPLDHGASGLERHLNTLHAALDSSGSSGRNPALTPAESRVLADTLMLQEIGERLSGGRATVKTYAAAVYRKLGAMARAGAVDAAAARGLLPS